MNFSSNNTVTLSSSRLRLCPSKCVWNTSAPTMDALRLSSAPVALMAQDYGAFTMDISA